jgi:hypothetical protein
VVRARAVAVEAVQRREAGEDREAVGVERAVVPYSLQRQGRPE